MPYSPLVLKNTPLPSRANFQWPRKLLHLFNGCLGFWFYVYSGLDRQTVLVILAVTASANLLIDLLRYTSPVIRNFFIQHFSGVLREEEKNRLSSATKGLFMCLLILNIFPERVGILVMLFMTFSDTAGGIVGSYFGRVRLNAHTTLEGSLAVFFTSFLCCFYAFHFLFQESFFNSPILFFSLLSSAIVTLSESLFPKWDDNVVIPMLCSPALWVLFKLLNIPMG